MALKAILGGKIFTPSQTLVNSTLIIENDRISAIERRQELPSMAQFFDASNCLITPGLIDLHIHGAMGHNAMGPGLAEVIKYLPRHGVTSFLPTTLTAPPPVIRTALSEMAEIINAPPNGARALGIHLEGPHLSAQRPGMANPAYFQPLSQTEWAELQTLTGNSLKMVTFAPEDGHSAAMIPALLQEGVVPTIGHSNATFEQVGDMVRLGLAHATHMFNAMSPFHHRAPGVAGAVLYYEQIVAQLITDMHHVHPGAISVLLKIKGADKITLISDAAPLAGLANGDYNWNDETRATIKDNTCRLPNGTLAGAATFLDTNVANLLNHLGLSLAEVLPMATSVPGQVLGLKRGQLRPGWLADIAVWDENFQPVATMVEGEWVWQQERLSG